LARKLEAHAEDVVDAYLRGIRSSDERVAYRAAEAWLSRVYGKPTEYVKTEDVVASDFDPAQLANMSREERHALLRRLGEQHPDLVRSILGPRGLTHMPKRTIRLHPT
jgi:hypothetical protein